MAGSNTIQVHPPGLLSALNMKGTGSAPQELSGVISGSMDLRSLYLEGRRDIVSVTGPAPSAGTYTFNTGGTVPSGEFWLVSRYSFLFTTDATASGSMSLAYSLYTSTSVQLVGGMLTMPAGTARQYALSYEFPAEPMVLMAGSSLGIWCVQLVAGTFTTALRADIYRLAP